MNKPRIKRSPKLAARCAALEKYGSLTAKHLRLAPPERSGNIATI
ncbi:hypothetical protein [Pseudanabaena yagii]|nr:hypothetical protein [Pseudanabaena yagii]